MKRIALYLVILLVAMLLSGERTDVGKLRPVEAILLYKEGEMLVIETDTGDSGVGETAERAYKNLKETTAGVIFLDTAEYLLVEPTAEGEILSMSSWLKPSTRICYAPHGTDLSMAAEYLSEHTPSVKMKKYGDGAIVETLIVKNGRMQLKKLEIMKKELDKGRNI